MVYEVTLDSLTTRSRSLAVAMHFRPVGPGPVVLALPAWTPGHYTLLWFARRISSFSPTQAGAPLQWHQLDYQTWQLDSVKTGTPVSVSFDYLADTNDRAVAWTRPDSFGFFNGTNVFMYPVGRGFNWPAQVIIHASRSWKIATGMTALPQWTCRPCIMTTMSTTTSRLPITTIWSTCRSSSATSISTA